MKAENTSNLVVLSELFQSVVAMKDQDNEKKERVPLQPLTEEQKAALKKQLKDVEDEWKDGPVY